MATLTIRDLDDSLKHRLRVRAAGFNRSMEEEARQILRAALSAPTSPGGPLVSRIRARCEQAGGVELTLPPREPVREPPDLGAAFGEARTPLWPKPLQPRKGGARAAASASTKSAPRKPVGRSKKP